MTRTRRTFTLEFMAQAVKLVTERGKSLAKAGEDAFPGKGNPPALEEELRRPRAEVKRMTMERDVLKEATAFFAGESSLGTTSSVATGADGRSG